ncbi:hypothetical protein V1477_004277 [Vespula maculifrons]|uniref:Uncharacterized protein n=1 Tax=Vespula maculifrons TaxID=7453 RepID=A0ABD2CR72_VESMC
MVVVIGLEEVRGLEELGDGDRVILSNSNSDGTDAKATFQNSMTVDKWTFQLITSWNRLTLIALLPEGLHEPPPPSPPSPPPPSPPTQLCNKCRVTSHENGRGCEAFREENGLASRSCFWVLCVARDGNGREWIPSDTAYRTLQPRRSEDFGRLVLTSCERLWIEPPTCTINQKWMEIRKVKGNNPWKMQFDAESCLNRA